MKSGYLKLPGVVYCLLTFTTMVAFAQDSDLLRQIDEVLKQADQEIAQIRDELEQLSHMPAPDEPRSAELRQLEVTIQELALEGVQREKKIFQEKRRLLLLHQEGKISAQEMQEKESSLSQSLRPALEQWKKKMKDAQERKSHLESEPLRQTR
jgi:phage regulator Rha-like protein